MAETAQALAPAESEVASEEMSLEDAANAFKNIDAPERTRDERGRFASTQEIEAESDEVQPEEAESHEPEETAEEQPEEAQPEAVELPTSWPSDKAAMWAELDPDAQAFIRQRDAEQSAAVNAKFQEAANVRKANEGLIAEAQQSRQKFVEAADHVLSMVQPQRPPLSMLTPGSSDYNPDHYHLLNAQADQTERLLSAVSQQRQEAVAQLTREAETRAFEQMAEIEAKSRPALLKDVPDLADPGKFRAALDPVLQYAVQNGIPEAVFTDPEQAKYVTSAQIHLAWKAMQYDKMNEAKSKVQPKAAKPAAPPVRPGVTTPKSAIEATQRKSAMARLERSGSVEDAAAVFKHLT